VEKATEKATEWFFLVTHQFTDTSVIHSELCHLQNWGLKTMGFV
jgi:hypothetical protein